MKVPGSPTPGTAPSGSKSSAIESKSQQKPWNSNSTQNKEDTVNTNKAQSVPAKPVSVSKKPAGKRALQDDVDRTKTKGWILFKKNLVFFYLNCLT